MNEITTILKHFALENSELAELAELASHSHGPDMWSHTFKINNKSYVLVEVESLGSDLNNEEYEYLCEDLHTTKDNLKLIQPTSDQIRTVTNQLGIGIDGHKKLIKLSDWQEYNDAVEKAQAAQYFPPISDEDLPEFDKSKEFENPNKLDTDTSWLLFEVK